MSLLGGGRRLGGLGLGAARVMKKTNDDDESDGSEEELKPKQVYLQKSQNSYDKSPSMELDGDEDDGHGEMEMASSLLDILGGSTKNPPQPSQQEQQSEVRPPYTRDLVSLDTSRDEWAAVYDSPNSGTKRKKSGALSSSASRRSSISTRRNSSLLSIGGTSSRAQRVKPLTPSTIKKDDISNKDDDYVEAGR